MKKYAWKEKFAFLSSLEGYVSPKISMETILLYFEVIRHGFYDTPNITEQVNRKPELLKELIQLMTYGLNG